MRFCDDVLHIGDSMVQTDVQPHLNDDDDGNGNENDASALLAQMHTATLMTHTQNGIQLKAADIALNDLSLVRIQSIHDAMNCEFTFIRSRTLQIRLKST